MVPEDAMVFLEPKDGSNLQMIRCSIIILLTKLLAFVDYDLVSSFYRTTELHALVV